MASLRPHAIIADPSARRLRCYAFDPSVSTALDSYQINEICLELPWDGRLEKGPTDDYLEVVDYDPSSRMFYAPADLSDGKLLAQDGYAPSEGNPQFHQQMVYAVARTTILEFERALGRKALWSPHLKRNEQGEIVKLQFVRKLRLYPHALREANAYYSPERKALLFGYFPARIDAATGAPQGIVFSCLSYDVIAHEMTHALLDGVHRRFIENSNPDSLAFHEAFADIVALFQHFSHPQVLRHQLAKTRGDLRQQNLLGQLAQQFGMALGSHGALRDYLGSVDKATGEWKQLAPDPKDYAQADEPHQRGAILVAAIFDAFLSIYHVRTRGLVRAATGGTGLFPQGDLHPDLVERLALEAAKSARHVLQMCIRAIDYLPPVDVTFGEYLRAIITADFDLVEDDDLGYRVAVVEAFRKRGVYPPYIQSVAPDSLRWSEPGGRVQRFFKNMLEELDFPCRCECPNRDRKEIFEEMIGRQKKISDYIHEQIKDAAKIAGELGMQLDEMQNHQSFSWRRDELEDQRLYFEVHSTRTIRRIGPDGNERVDLLIEFTQERRGYHDPVIQGQVDAGTLTDQPPDFPFRGGSTVIIDLCTRRVRYAVNKNILSNGRLDQQRQHLRKQFEAGSNAALYFGGYLGLKEYEPFAFLHRE